MLHLQKYRINLVRRTGDANVVLLNRKSSKLSDQSLQPVWCLQLTVYVIQAISFLQPFKNIKRRSVDEKESLEKD